MNITQILYRGDEEDCFQCRFQTRNIGDGVSVALGGGGRDGSSPMALGLRYSNVLKVLQVKPFISYRKPVLVR